MATVIYCDFIGRRRRLKARTVKKLTWTYSNYHLGYQMPEQGARKEDGPRNQDLVIDYVWIGNNLENIIPISFPYDYHSNIELIVGTLVATFSEIMDMISLAYAAAAAAAYRCQSLFLCESA